MASFGVLGRRIGAMVAVGTMVVATFAPAFVSAAQITERSIQLSSSAKSATNVTYKIDFTPVSGAGAFVVDFCKNSPVIGATCTSPSGDGFSASAASTSTAGFTVSALSATTIQVNGTVTTAVSPSVEISGITNPNVAGTLYARIVTFDTTVNAANYTSTEATPTGSVDMGGVALSITDKINVSAAVLESMTFCLSGNAISENCGGTLTAPVLTLGANTGAGIALDPNSVYTGTVNTQLSTNAVGGAVVRLKSSATGCGGLIRAGAPSAAAGCGIAPAQSTDIAAGEAKFGVKTTAAVGAGTGFNGVLQPASGSVYNNSTYAMRYVNETDGVTSTYGDAFLDTNNAPVNNMGMALTFGASSSNSTPAGTYSADLSLIASGKF